jgi:hypothetical protein
MEDCRGGHLPNDIQSCSTIERYPHKTVYQYARLKDWVYMNAALMFFISEVIPADSGTPSFAK